MACNLTHQPAHSLKPGGRTGGGGRGEERFISEKMKVEAVGGESDCPGECVEVEKEMG